MTGKMTAQRSGTLLVESLPPLFLEIETGIGTGTGTGTETEKVKKRRPPGERRKIGNLFVVLKMRLMKTDGPRYDAKSPDNGFKLLSYLGLIPFRIIILVLQPISIGFFNIVSP